MDFNDLSTLDLAGVETQIRHFTTHLSQSYWEIGRRLIYVKEDLLSHGDFVLWLTTMTFEYEEAYRMMYIAKNLPEIGDYCHLGISLLYLIATIPENYRKVTVVLPSGQAKSLPEMTQAELRLYKRQLRLGLLPEPRDGQVVLVEEVATKRGLLHVAEDTTCDAVSHQDHALPSDSLAQPSTEMPSQPQLGIVGQSPAHSQSPANPLAPKLAEAEATNQRLRDALKQANAQYAADLQDIESRYRYLKQFREGLTHFAEKSTSYMPDLEGLNRIIQFSHEIDHWLAKLAPMRYIDDFAARQNQVMVDHYLKQVDRVAAWVDSMRDTIARARQPQRQDVTPDAGPESDDCQAIA